MIRQNLQYAMSHSMRRMKFLLYEMFELTTQWIPRKQLTGHQRQCQTEVVMSPNQSQL
jgi:hypothetical protein